MSYVCSGNGETYEGKPWMTLNYERWDNIRGPVTFSSYLEYKNSLDKIPKRHFELIVNKEDFNHIRPVIKQPQVEKFIFLTETEMNLLTNEQYKQYIQDYEEESMFNQTRTDIYQEGLLNDEYVKHIEENCNSDEDSSSIDDY